LFFGCGGGFNSSRPTKLTAEEDSLLQQNWKVAYQIADYDRFARIATDSLLKYVPEPDSIEFQGYVVSAIGNSTKVVFGKLSQSCLRSAFEVLFQGHRVICNPRPDTTYCGKDDPYLRFAAMSKARDLSMPDIKEEGFPYNTYVLGNGDSLIVYLMPGATGGRYGLCGGIRTLVDARNVAIVECKKLHRSALIITPPPQDAVALMRTSSLAVVPNEVDLAQTIIFSNLAGDHMITTSKYTFILSWDKARKNISTEILSQSLR
jgi:hypothetical protein